MEQIYAIIQNNLVVNTIVADQEFIDTAYPGSPRIDQLDPHPGIGWSYENGVFTPPPPPPEPPALVTITPALPE